MGVGTVASGVGGFAGAMAMTWLGRGGRRPRAKAMFFVTAATTGAVTLLTFFGLLALTDWS
jgi:hypothetical protein